VLYIIVLKPFEDAWAGMRIIIKLFQILQFITDT